MKGLKLYCVLKTLALILLLQCVNAQDQNSDGPLIRVPRGVSRMVAQLLFGGKPAGDLPAASSTSRYKPSDPFDDMSFDYGNNFYQSQFDSLQANRPTQEDNYYQPSEDLDFLYQPASLPFGASGFEYEGNEREPLVAIPAKETPTKGPHSNRYLSNLVASGSQYIGNIVRNKEDYVGKMANMASSYWRSIPSLLPRRRQSQKSNGGNGDTYNARVPSYEDEYYNY